MGRADFTTPGRPPGRPAMQMTWRWLLFAHWPLPAEAVQPLLPGGLLLDTFQGAAWVGLIPFTMRDVRVTCLPAVPTAHHFHEVNVRTYVRTPGGQPGVWFLSLDASSRLAVFAARKLWRLNYRLARITVASDHDVIHYGAERIRRRTPRRPRLRCSWRIGDPRPPSQPGDLDHFLTERYCLYTLDRLGRPRRGRIAHRPWSLREAELLELDDSLVAAAGITMPDRSPVLCAAEALVVHAWFPEPAA